MKKSFLLLIFIFSIILTSCSSLDSLPFGFGKDNNVGGKGVQLSFIEAPQNNERISEGIPFTITMGITNNVVNDRGIYGSLCLRDGLSDNFAGIPSDSACRQVDLPSATKIDNRVIPARETYNFGPFVYTRLQKEFEYSTVISAYLSYEVSSVAGAMACVKRREAESSSIPANCGDKQNLQVQQTDLPVKISSLSSKASVINENEVLASIDITLSKAAKGQIVSKSNVIGNQAGLGSADIDFEVLVDLIPAKCTGVSNNRITLRQNEDQKVIKCTARLLLEQDYKQLPITIKIGYGFMQVVDGPTIKLIKEEDS